ncbi:MAG: hypothetical protein HY868_19340 [Chloroflexi bacterium]|nr:hypothetical protein [Chloroflexota bacterium]
MDITQQLGELETAQLLRQLIEEEPAYIFKHVLTQENAYNSLLQKQRREIHQRVAQAYEQIYADRLDEHAALLMQHYANAGNDAKTMTYAIRAGDIAARVHANVEAIAHYTRALGIAKNTDAHSDAVLQDLYLKRGRQFELNSQYDAALANYEEMETHARACGNRALELAALIARATIYSIPNKQFDIPRANALCDQALALARALGDQPAQAKVLWNLMLLNSRLNTNYREAIGYGDQAIEIARTHNLREQLAYLLNDIGLVYSWEGESERGKAVNLESRQMWRALNNLPMLTDNLSYATMIHISLGEYEQAITASLEALEISRSIGNTWGETFSQSWVGQAHRELGHIADAITAMENAVRLAAHSFQAPLSFTRADLGSLYGDLGQVKRGLELATLAQIEGRRLAHVMRVWTSARLAHLHLLDGDIASAETLVNETNPLLSATDRTSLFGSGMLVVSAELALAQNDLARAIQASDQLIEFQRSRRLWQFLSNALYLKGIALQRQNKSADAWECFAEGRAEAIRLNSRWLLWRIYAALSEIEAARGNIHEANTLRTHARVVIEYIAAHTPEELRTSFLNLPDVRAVMH